MICSVVLIDKDILLMAHVSFSYIILSQYKLLYVKSEKLYTFEYQIRCWMGEIAHGKLFVFCIKNLINPSVM